MYHFDAIVSDRVAMIDFLPVIAAIAFLVACRPTPSPTVFLDPALAVLVPRDTTVLAGIRMQRMQSTTFYDEFVRNAPRLARFREAAGLYDNADVWEYLIVSNGKDPVVLMRGKFSEMGMEPRSNKPDAVRISHRGVTIIGDERGAIAFLNPTTAIAGTVDAIKRTLDERNENTGVPEALKLLVGEIPSTNEAWIVSIGPAPGFLPVATVKSARAALNPRSRTFDFAAQADSEEAAKSIAEAIGGHAHGRSVTAAGPIPAEVLTWCLQLQRAAFAHEVLVPARNFDDYITFDDRLATETRM